MGPTALDVIKGPVQCHPCLRYDCNGKDIFEAYQPCKMNNIILLRATEDRKLWQSVIAKVQKGQGK